MEAQEHVDANAPDGKGKGSKARKKPGAKTPTEGTGKRSLNLRVDDETYERLTIHAMKRRATISDLVMEFARVHLREFSVHRNGQRNSDGGQD
jgi:hypothetical protein